MTRNGGLLGWDYGMGLWDQTLIRVYSMGPWDRSTGLIYWMGLCVGPIDRCFEFHKKKRDINIG